MMLGDLRVPFIPIYSRNMSLTKSSDEQNNWILKDLKFLSICAHVIDLFCTRISSALVVSAGP